MIADQSTSGRSSRAAGQHHRQCFRPVGASGAIADLAEYIKADGPLLKAGGTGHGTRRRKRLPAGAAVQCHDDRRPLLGH
jgi:hypothetical protein